MVFITKETDICFQSACILYFYAPWIPFHKKMIVMLDKMEQKYLKMNFYAINVDLFKQMCVRFSVDSVPTIIFFNKKELKRIHGLVLTSALKSVFSDICSGSAT